MNAPHGPATPQPPPFPADLHPQAMGHVPSPAPRTSGFKSWFRKHMVLLTGVTVGMVVGALGVSFAMADGHGGPPPVHEDVYIEYRANMKNEHVDWADWFSNPDTYMVIQFQSDPQNVYITPVHDDDGGAPHPEKLTVQRPFMPGEKAYVFLLDDDSWSNKMWKKVAQEGLKRGGAAIAKTTHTLSLGTHSNTELVQLCDAAGKEVGEMTLNANDLLGWATFTVGDQDLAFDKAIDMNLTDRDGDDAGTLRVVFGRTSATAGIRNDTAVLLPTKAPGVGGQMPDGVRVK